MDYNQPQLVMFEISKEEIKLLQFKRIEKLLTQLKKLGKEARSSLFIMFGGYDSVPEEVHEIPEIRRWAAKFVKRNPEVFYFLSREMQGDQILLTTLCDFTSIHVGEATKSPEEYYKDGVDPMKLPKKRIELELPEGLREMVTIAVMDHGKNIDDIEGARSSLAIFQIFDR